MADIKTQIKNKIKHKYKRQELDRYAKLSDKWKKPRGIDSHKRKHKKEDGIHPRKTHRTNKNIRFLHPVGLSEVIVKTLTDVPEKGTQVVVRIMRTVGARKKQLIVKKAEENGIKVLNK